MAGTAFRTAGRRGIAAAAAVTAAALAASVAPSPHARATTVPTRWVAVSVATVWTRPGIARPVDAPAVSNPADPRRWVAAMTLDQKRWLVGRLETQAPYATPVRVLGTSGSWTKVAVVGQPTPKSGYGYPGWVPTVQLTSSAPVSASYVAVVRYRTEWLHSTVSSLGTTAGRVIELSADTRLPVAHVTSSYVEVVTLGGRHRFLRRGAVAVFATGHVAGATRAAVLAQALRYRGLQYLWAGTSGFGVDCSGLTYSAYHAFGVTLPRDADRQAVTGTAVALASLLPADLVFVADSSGHVVHVAMYYGTVNGVRSILEAPRTGVAVRVVALSTYRYVAARRYLSR